MIKKLALVAFLAALSVNSMAEMRTVELAYEIEMKNFRAPGTPSGTVGIRECDNCQQKVLRVNAKTRYTVNDRNVSLADFRKQLQNNRNSEDTLLIVSHHIEDDIVTAITVTL